MPENSHDRHFGPTPRACLPAPVVTRRFTHARNLARPIPQHIISIRETRGRSHPVQVVVTPTVALDRIYHPVPRRIIILVLSRAIDLYLHLHADMGQASVDRGSRAPLQRSPPKRLSGRLSLRGASAKVVVSNERRTWRKRFHAGPFRHCHSV